MPAPFDRVAHDYDRTRGGTDRVQRFAERLDRHLPPDGIVLDIGAGTGTVTAELMMRRAHVIGIDIAARMHALAAERVPGRLIRGDAGRLPFRDNLFAAAYSVWVFQHLDDPNAVMKEAARILVSGGRFIIVTTNHYKRQDDISQLVDPVISRLRPDRNGRDDPDHLAALAERAGLRLKVLDWVIDEFMGTSPLEEAERIEGRSTSVLWDLTEIEWSAAIVPLLAELRALHDPHEKRRVRAENAVIVFTKPGDAC